MSEEKDFIHGTLLFEMTDEHGEVFEVDVSGALDMRKVGQSINSIGTTIAVLETQVAFLRREVNDQKSELDAWIAEEDGKVREKRGYGRGEAKITQCIRRSSNYLDRRYAINIAIQNLERAEGLLKALYVTADLLRTKDSTYRKHEELSEPAEEYQKKRNFRINRKEGIQKQIKKTKKKKRKAQTE